MTIRTRAFLWNEFGELLVLQHRQENNWWALPGGKLDPGESTQECIVRELAEELGIHVEDPKLLVIQELRDIDSLEFLFSIEIKKEAVQQDAEFRHEFYEMQWVKPEEFEPMLYPEFVKDRQYMNMLIMRNDPLYLLR